LVAGGDRAKIPAMRPTTPSPRAPSTRQFGLAVLVGLGLLLAGTAEARKVNKKEEAKVLFKTGQKEFKEGEYAAALESFAAAYDIKPHPDILFMMAQCHRNLHHFRQAIDGFKGYLKGKPEAQDREEVEQLILELERQDAEQSPAEPRPVNKVPPAAVVAPVPIAPVAPPPREETPVYKRWWFWTIIGGVALAGAGVGVGVYFGTRSATVPSGSFGTLDLR
jgi:hypothetical protein